MLELSSDFFDFIDRHSDEDIMKIILSLRSSQHDFPFDLAVIQIEARKKYKTKLKNFISNVRVIFPDSISGEQSSHEAVAKYHASLVKESDDILDITAGLGIDSFAFSKKGKSVVSLEMDENKAKTLEYNIHHQGIENMEVVNTEAINYLSTSEKRFDVIFADPARRDEMNKRVFSLSDCKPDVLANIDILRKVGKKILIKASPMLDIWKSIEDFKTVSSITVVGVKGECKEVLIEIIGEGYSQLSAGHSSVKIQAIDLSNSGEVISKFSTELSGTNTKQSFSTVLASGNDIIPGNFILEPNAMMMKMATWDKLSEKFPGIKKLDMSSHLFISSRNYPDFPGRITQIEKIIDKKNRESLIGFPATIVSRNYPIQADQIRKSMKISEGDSNFIYASRIGKKPIMILSSKIQKQGIS